MMLGAFTMKECDTMIDLKILVVDDNHDFAISMADVLELNGCTVDMAFNGENAIKKYTETDYDFAFIDVKLPGLNGVDSYLEIKKIRPEAKVIIMTGFSVKQLLNKAIQNGVLEVLYKPFDMTKVLELLKHR